MNKEEKEIKSKKNLFQVIFIMNILIKKKVTSKENEIIRIIRYKYIFYIIKKNNFQIKIK